MADRSAYRKARHASDTLTTGPALILAQYYLANWRLAVFVTFRRQLEVTAVNHILWWNHALIFWQRQRKNILSEKVFYPIKWVFFFIVWIHRILVKMSFEPFLRFDAKLWEPTKRRKLEKIKCMKLVRNFLFLQLIFIWNTVLFYLYQNLRDGKKQKKIIWKNY